MLARITVNLPADLINRTKKESQAKLQAADAADWQRLGVEQFFAGYADSDAVYDLWSLARNSCGLLANQIS